MEGPKTSGSNIRVFCRFRPFNFFEQQSNHNPVHRIVSNRHLVIKDSSRHQQMPFLFDQVFDIDTVQEEIYNEVGAPVLLNILDGFNGTIMAYGQTSSGKTYTMQGPDLNSWEQKGLIPRIIEDLFFSIEKSPENLQFKLKVSIFEIYMEKVRDLLDLSKNDLKVRQNKHGPYIQYITEAYIGDKAQFYRILHLGQKNRATCATNMNSHSSRSHMIFLLTLNQLNSETSQAKTSKLYLVDLAGSEKVSKTGAEGLVLEEAKKINMSLASLGKVIKGLSSKIHHIPYRDSKLTRIIRDSLGGNSKTTLIVTCSPHELHISETISSLRFGESAQKIKNKPKINRELTTEELQAIIQKLEASLEEKKKRIKFLQGYIKNDLGGEIPKSPPKTPGKKIRQSEDNLLHSTTDLNAFRCSISSHHIQQADQYSFFQKYEKSSYLLGQSLQIQHNVLNSLGSSTNYDERFSSLETQLASSKANLKSQLNKYYHLKKQYNSLNQNMKEVISENLVHQEREKQFEEEANKVKESIIQKFKEMYDEVGQNMMDKSKGCSCKCLSIQAIQQYFTQKWIQFQQDIEKIKIQFQVRDQTILPIHQNMVILQQGKKHGDKQGHQQHLLHPKFRNRANQNNNSRVSLAVPEMAVEENLLDDDSYCEPSNEKMKKLESELHGILKQKSGWKIEEQLYKRKIRQKDSKIEGLQEMLKEISEQTKIMMEEYEEVSVNSKIIKPIKGGGCLYN